MLLALLLGQLVLQPADPRGPIVTNPATMRRLAFFEAFPASGAGTFGACSTTPPTGAKGEVLTFTRGSTATCTKTATGGLATTGIANGDLVVMASNQPRVEYGSAGTLGLLVESSRTNSCLHSEEIDNAVWSSSTGAGAVTVTADQAIAPDGTLTADRLQVSACPAAGVYSARWQAMALVSTRTWSVYVRGNGTSGNIGMIVGGGATYSGVVCPYVSTSWTRCSVSATAVAGDAWIGCVNATVASPNPGNTGAADVFVWGGQAELGSYATSYIPTTSAAVTRAAEVPYFPITWPVSPMLDLSEAVSMNRPASVTSINHMGICAGPSGTSDYACTYVDGSLRAAIEVTRTAVPVRKNSTTASAVLGPTNTVRLAGSQSSTTAEAFLAGVSDWTTTAGAVPDWTVTRSYIGTWSGGNYQPDGIISRVCLDPNPLRCR